MRLTNIVFYEKIMIGKHLQIRVLLLTERAKRRQLANSPVQKKMSFEVFVLQVHLWHRIDNFGSSLPSGVKQYRR